ncbi:MAG: T9SS type A sorting domain-containing protein [Bacteroidetes bacterium]|nr:T9SS type A sorting domain-containing protein [Bacteroidota bacterium]
MYKFVVCAFLSISSQVVFAQNADSSLVVYYKFDGNALDAGVYHNDGIENGGVQYTPGLKGLALYCDGYDDFITTYGNEYLNSIQKEYTIALWLKPFGVPSFYLPVLTKGNDYGMNTPLAVIYRSPETTPYVRIVGEGQPTFEAINFEQVTNSTPFNEWTFITWSFKNGVLDVYKNGMLMLSHQFGFEKLATNNLPMDLGRDVPGFSTEFYFGLMDEVSIYNKSMNRSQVDSLYNSYFVTSTNHEGLLEGTKFISITPNPSNSWFNLQYGFTNAGPTAVYLYNIEGQMVKHVASVNQELKSNTLKVETSDLPSGFYHILVTRNGESLNSRLVVSR